MWDGSMRRIAWRASGTPSATVICLALISSLTFAFIAVSFLVGPAMFSDSGWGFLAWDSMVRGAPFNSLFQPDPEDISRDVTVFLTVWTPGQYVLPGLLEKAGISLGSALTVVTSVFSVLGLVGWHALYRAFGFPLQTTMVALAVIACSRFFNLPFLIYNGGEVLLFGLAPWFLLLVWSSRDLRWRTVPPLVAGAVVLLFAKLTGIIVAGAAIGARVLSADGAGLNRETIRKGVVAAVAVGAIGILFRLVWQVHGQTAAEIVVEPHETGLPFFIAFVVGSLWSASLSLGDLASYILIHPARPVATSIDAVYYALMPVALVIVGTTCWHLRRSHGEYLRFSLLIFAAMAGLLVLLWLRASTISFEERHLRVPSLLLLVGIVHVFLDAPRWLVRAAFLLVVGAASAYGIASFTVRAAASLESPIGARGVRLRTFHAEALAFLNRIDVVDRNGRRPLVLVPSPEITIEFQQARAWSNHADFESLATLQERTFKGRVPELYIFLPRRLMANGKAAVILKSLSDYPIDRWTMVLLGDFICFHQGDAAG